MSTNPRVGDNEPSIEAKRIEARAELYRKCRTPVFVTVGLIGPVGSVAALWAMGWVPSGVSLVVLMIPGLATALGFAGLVGVKTWWQRHEKRARREQEHAATHDALTGLINRGELFRQLSQTLEDGSRNNTSTALLFLDLDRFKQINDTLGHDAGDQMLQIAAERLRGAVRGSDIAARLGGDEFVVVCRGLLDGASALGVAHQILKKFEEPVSLKNVVREVGTSIGVAIAKPNDLKGPDELLREADAAMYRAKRSRGGHALFDRAEQRLLDEQKQTGVELDRAIESRQFGLAYQPVIDVVRQRMFSIEGLLRWNHPERGLVVAAEFMEVAENAGRMHEIGDVVLREACAQMALWGEQTPAATGVSVAVNISAAQLGNSGLVHMVDDAIAWTGIQPSQLVLEVSEELAAEKGSLEAIEGISTTGVGLVIDSFTGDKLPIGQLSKVTGVVAVKLGRQLIAGDLDDPRGQRLLRSLTRSVQELGLAIVAEGVERVEQFELLRSLGVDLMQGYLFCEPLGSELVDPAAWFGRWDDRVFASANLRLGSWDGGMTNVSETSTLKPHEQSERI